MNRTDAICLVIIILVVVGIISAFGYSWYTDSQKKPKSKGGEPELFIREGDLITVDFTEYIWTKDSTGNITYAVFQTTKKSVAEDDSIPKSVTFKKILTDESGDPITRDRISAIVGKDLITEMNKGFNDMVLDMTIDQTKKGIIPTSDGYGERNDSLVQTIPIQDKLPMFETYDRLDFEANYPEEVPLEIGQSFRHHYWNWFIRIDSITEDEIVIKHQPEIGFKVEILPWDAIVENVSSATGYIWLKHKPTSDIVNTAIDAESLEVYNPQFTEIKEMMTNTQQPYPGIITSIQNGIQIDFNRENIGKNIMYEITIIKIERD